MSTSAIELTARASKSVWAGRILSGLAVAFLLFDGTLKLMRAAPAVQGTMELGYPERVIPKLGAVLLVCTVLYALPRTAVLGAILTTGYLGGAVAAQVRVGNPLFSHVLFPVYVGILLWAGLFLRDARLRQLVPVRRTPQSLQGPNRRRFTNLV